MRSASPGLRLRPGRALAGLCLAGVALGGCDTPSAPPRARPARDEAPREATAPARADGERTRGSFFSLALPEGATEETPTQPEVVAHAYTLSEEEGVTLSIFRPMPAQAELGAWVDVVERLLEGIPERHDETDLGGQPARVATLPGELRWMLVLDGQGILVRCVARTREDEGWMHDRCDRTVSSLTFVRAIE